MIRADLSAAMRFRRAPACLAITLVALASGLAAREPAVAAAAPSPYHHNLAQVSAHLRIAIEIRPAQLAEYLRSSELVCGLGERSEGRGDEPGAAANWTTLSQLVRELDRRETRAIDDAFARADSAAVRRDLDRMLALFPRLAERSGQSAGIASRTDPRTSATPW